ncbi:MAG: Hsp70 family protein, partial [Bacilli bacterium]|nr:Hsp70 family protein [Bacilli bacterium]
EQSITIQAGSGLSEDEIQRMIKEAEQFAEEDKRKAEEAQLKNEASQLIWAANKAVNDLGANVTQDEKQKVERLSQELQHAIDNNDISTIKSKKAELEKLSQDLAARVYQQNSQQYSQSQDKKNGNDDVVDADYEDVK